MVLVSLLHSLARHYPLQLLKKLFCQALVIKFNLNFSRLKFSVRLYNYVRVERCWIVRVKHD